MSKNNVTMVFVWANGFHVEVTNVNDMEAALKRVAKKAVTSVAVFVYVDNVLTSSNVNIDMS